MPDPREMQETDGIENPRMMGDSADQIFDDDTLDAPASDVTLNRSGGRGGTGGLSGGAGVDSGKTITKPS